MASRTTRRTRSPDAIDFDTSVTVDLSRLLCRGCCPPGALASFALPGPRRRSMSRLSVHLMAARRFARELSNVGATASLDCTARYLLSVASSFPDIVRAGTLAPADAKMARGVCHFRPFGTDVVLPGSLFSGAREI